MIWGLSGTGEARQQRALRLIGVGFAALAVHLRVRSTWVPAAGHPPRHAPPGTGWTAVTAVGWWWADPAVGYGLVHYAVREVREIFTGSC